MESKIPALIIYGSSTGKTARMANIVKQALTEVGLDVYLKNVFETRPRELLEYPYILLGCSTYGQGDLQQDFIDFERGMDALDLSGKQAAVFGSGNSRYAYFGEAVDILEARLRNINARLLLPGYRQNMMTEAPEGQDFQAWTRDLAETILQNRRHTENRL